MAPAQLSPAGLLSIGAAWQNNPEHLQPHFDDVQAHYDLSDDFFALFLDPTRILQLRVLSEYATDSCRCEEAQLAKIDLALGKLGLQPGMTLLDVGCGWGATVMRAIERYDVNVVGLTLSRNQAAHVQRRFDESDSPRSKRVQLAGWEQFERAGGSHRLYRRVRTFRPRPL